MRRKAIAVVCTVALALAVSLAPDLRAQIPAAASPYDYYRVGEACLVINYFSYLAAIASNMAAKFKEHRDLLVKVNASAPTLQAFDQYVAFVTSLPFAKDWGSWTEADKKKWRETDAWSPMFKAVRTEAEKNPQNELLFWLGKETLRFSWLFPKQLNDDGYKLSELVSAIKGAVGSMAWVRDHSVFKNLTAEVQGSVRTIVDYKAKFDDPLSEGITQADVTKMAEAAQVIRQAARGGKLVP